MTLARRLGRPFVERAWGTERITHWERVLHADSIWVWFLLMASPVGDIPYYLAGLSRVPIWKILGVVAITRGPAVWAAAAIGAGAARLSPQWLMGALLAIVILGILLLRIGQRLAKRLEGAILHHVSEAGTLQEPYGNHEAQSG